MSEGVPEQPSVLVVGGNMDGYDVKLTPGLTLIVGSGRLANLRLDHPEIELAHIKIIWDDLGISMIDNGSRKGTWCNGEPVETVALLDGDTIEFVEPGSKVKPPPPKVRLRIPKGSVPEPPPLPPAPPGEVQAKPAPGPAPAKARGPVRRKRSALRMPDVDPRLVALGAGALLVLVLGGWLVNHYFFTVPSIASVQPAQAEMGQTITLTGARFDSDATDNQVWFGTVPVLASTTTGDTLQVQVPMLASSGRVAVSVETPIGRSRSVSLMALAPLRVASLEPPGALPKDEVVVSGSGFGEDLSITVSGQAARVLKAEPHAVRFEMPQVAGTPGSLHPVIVSSGGRSTPPVQLYLGRLPLVAGIDPPHGVAGDLVRVRGAGFTGETTLVTFDGNPALVVAGDTGQLAVVVPSSSRSQPEVLVPVVVQAGGRTSSQAAGFTLQRLVEGAWVPRFFAGAPGEGGTAGQATVGTELAPVLLLSWRDESRSVGERALLVAKALNAAVDRARLGQPVAFEAREEPEIAVALVGAPDWLVKILPQDAAAYEAPPGHPARGAPPTAIALARHWAALLTDIVTIGTSGARPKATAELGPPWSLAFTQLRTALPWQYGSGVASARVVAVPADLRTKLREAAFRVP